MRTAESMFDNGADKIDIDIGSEYVFEVDSRKPTVVAIGRSRSHWKGKSTGSKAASS